MSELRIYFSGEWKDITCACPWAICDDQGAVLQSGIATLDDLPKGHECVGIVAADKVLEIATMLPAGGRRRWQSVLPFVAEEYSLADPEENHVVPGGLMADGRRMLAIVDKHWLKRIVDLARDNSLSLRKMVVESLMPVLSQNCWSLVWDGKTGFVKTGDSNSTALDLGDDNKSPVALRLSLDTAVIRPKHVEFRFTPEVREENRKIPHWADLDVQLVAGAKWDWRTEPLSENVLNLLWGEFSPSAKIQEWWPKIRPAIYLLLAVVVVEIAGSNIEWALLANKKYQLTKNMQRTFHNTFGDSVNLVNAPLQMQRNLAELRHVAGLPDTGDYLSLTGLAGRSLAPLAAGSLSALHYEAGRLDAVVKLEKKADFQTLKSRLQNSGLSVQVGNIRETGGAYEAKLTMLAEGSL